MANSEAGERIGRVGRQREYIEGENQEKGFGGEVAREGGGHQGSATQLHSNPRSKSKIYRSKRMGKTQRSKGRWDNIS